MVGALLLQGMSGSVLTDAKRCQRGALVANGCGQHAAAPCCWASMRLASCLSVERRAQAGRPMPTPPLPSRHRKRAVVASHNPSARHHTAPRRKSITSPLACPAPNTTGGGAFVCCRRRDESEIPSSSRFTLNGLLAAMRTVLNAAWSHVVCWAPPPSRRHFAPEQPLSIPSRPVSQRVSSTAAVPLDAGVRVALPPVFLTGIPTTPPDVNLDTMAAAGAGAGAGLGAKVHVSEHPVLKHKLAHMRKRGTDPSNFRRLLKEVTFYLG